MKKILLATSALVATAGMAVADVKLSGLGRFGVLYIENAAQETRLEQRFRLTIDGSTEADGGIKFGARIRMQADDTATDSTVARLNAPRFTVSAGGLTLGVGNIFGALDATSGAYAGGQFGLSGLNWANVVTNFGSDTYSSAGLGRNGVELIYTMGDFTAHISNSTKGFDRTELVLAYTFSGITVTGGYLDSDRANDTDWLLSAAGTFAGFGVALAVAEDNEGDMSAALAGSYKIGAATKVGAFIAYDENFSNVVGRDDTAFGFEVEHSLGGGATIVGGYSTDHGLARADLGVTFNF
jgi:outer membrane protein OmpU